MLFTLTKYIYIIFCIFFIFRKLLNLNFSNTILYKSIGLSASLSLIFSICNTFLLKRVSVFSFLFIVFLSFLGSKILFKQPTMLTFNINIISVGLSFLGNVISVLLTSPIFYFFKEIMDYNWIFKELLNLIIGILQITLIVLFFRIPRFNTGLKFLYKIQNSQLFTLFSCGIIFLYYTLRFPSINEYFYVSLFLFIILIGVFIYNNSQRQLIENHLRFHYARTLNSLENEIKLVKNDINHWKNHSYELANIIHKDNKLIPAMIAAVEQLSTNYTPEKANEILANLQQLSNERKGIIKEQINHNIVISELGCIRIDAIINYMFQKALDSNIDFIFDCNDDIYNIIPKYISDVDLATLIADIVENAIIATKSEECKNIRLHINAKQEPYSINVYDSGSLFAKEVLNYFGKSRYTTHKKDGGSGIGLMTIFELTNKYKASYTIDETTDYSPYTKCVSISFDKKHEHTYNGRKIL